MTQLDMLTTLVDAARQLPENRHLAAAIKSAEKKIARWQEARKQRIRRQDAYAATGAFGDADLARIAQANKERFMEAGRCPSCGFPSSHCQCWDSVNSIKY